jgi:hypothetical protein
MAKVDTTVPTTMPAMPNGPANAIDTATFTTSTMPDRRVTSQGRWRLKNVRVSSRLTPENGSENENHSSAVETSSVDAASNAPRW